MLVSPSFSPRTPGASTVWTIEGWRGLAAWLVVGAHFQLLAGLETPLLQFAFTGVDLFFVLSGCVFAPYFLGRPLAWRSFAVRRFFRIYPAYAAALILYVALKWQQAGSGAEALKYVPEHLWMGHLQSREMAFFYNPAFWSLPPEVEFYMGVALLAASVSRLAWGWLGLLALALLVRGALGLASDPVAQNAAYIYMHHLPGMLVEFMLGVGAWWLGERLVGGWVKVALLGLGVLGWIGLALVFAALGDSGLQSLGLHGQVGWLAALCFAAMVAATLQPPSWAPGSLVALSLWAGRLSYGAYLLHSAALAVVAPHAAALGRAGATAAAVGLTLAGASCLFYFLEDPLRRWGRSLAKHRWASGAPATQ